MTEPLTAAQVAEFRAALAAALGDGTWKHKVVVLPPGPAAPPPAGPLDAVSDLCVTPAGGSISDPPPACPCGSADQVIWAPAFSEWLCFTCRTKRTWDALGETAAQPAGGPRPPLGHCTCDWPPGNPFTVHRPWCGQLPQPGAKIR